MPPANRDEEGREQEVPCKLCQQNLTLEHIIMRCPAVKRNLLEEEWIIVKNGLEIVGHQLEFQDVDEENQEEEGNNIPEGTYLDYWLHSDRDLKERERVGRFIRKNWNNWNNQSPLIDYYPRYRKTQSKRKPNQETESEDEEDNWLLVDFLPLSHLRRRNHGNVPIVEGEETVDTARENTRLQAVNNQRRVFHNVSKEPYQFLSS